mmetsp:Transcript_61882/g.152382  ORF Transcript_61882/g.152382 Transcript_61882/m.152382 type:complete len:118 (+) Transcript_61882:58-411(+)
MRTLIHFRAILALGVAFLCHAGYSTIQYHKFLRLIGEDYKGSPADILLECLLGFLLCAFAVLNLADDFLPVKMAHTFRDKTLDDYSFRPDYTTFNHRGRVVGKMLLGSSGQSSKKTS